MLFFSVITTPINADKPNKQNGVNSSTQLVVITCIVDV
jgi:hypothetical protein